MDVYTRKQRIKTHKNPKERNANVNNKEKRRITGNQRELK